MSQPSDVICATDIGHVESAAGFGGLAPWIPGCCDSGVSGFDVAKVAQAFRMGAGDDSHRTVAIKRFQPIMYQSFQREVSMLRLVGMHPNIVRMLDSVDGHKSEESVIVFESCPGGDLYEYYAAEHRKTRSQMSEDTVAVLMWQALQALARLQEVGVEHRDVKPENMFLYVCAADKGGYPRLKLGDFGWSCQSRHENTGFERERTTGGSMGYAPPELSPEPLSPRSRKSDETRNSFRGPAGSSDMWGIGVVSYLLMVGRGPFKAKAVSSLREEGHEQITKEHMENRLLDLIHSGEIDRDVQGWQSLSEDAQNFVEGLIRRDPADRCSLAEALRHPFLRLPRQLLRKGGSQHSMDELSRRVAWSGLDGLQRLGWLAVAHAASEVELQARTVDQAIRAVQEGKGRYQEILAGCLLAENVRKPIKNWTEVARFAFQYLDLDGDGLLSMQDLVQHTEGARDAGPKETKPPEGSKQSPCHPAEAALAWVLRWKTEDATVGLSFEDFQGALGEAVSTACVAACEEGDWPFDFGSEATNSPLPQQGRRKLQVTVGIPSTATPRTPGGSGYGSPQSPRSPIGLRPTHRRWKHAEADSKDSTRDSASAGVSRWSSPQQELKSSPAAEAKDDEAPVHSVPPFPRDLAAAFDGPEKEGPQNSGENFLVVDLDELRPIPQESIPASQGFPKDIQEIPPRAITNLFPKDVREGAKRWKDVEEDELLRPL